jgi:hypothetical protein
MTDALTAEIRAMKAADPDLSHAEIGRRLTVNTGRLSETLRGRRLSESKAVIITPIAASTPISATRSDREPVGNRIDWVVYSK